MLLVNKDLQYLQFLLKNLFERQL